MRFRLSPPVHATPGEAHDLGTDAGVRDAWTAHGSELRAYAFRRLGDHGLAEDAVQETFLRAWRNAGSFNTSRGSVRTWLYAIMRNLLVDLARARAVRPQTSPEMPDVAAGDALDGLLGSLTVADALRRLSPEHRHVIVQNYVTQRSHSEIAELLGVPVGTVRSRLFYRREALSNALRQIGAVERGPTPLAA
jgi:RNA polymerase sigma-70 factor (ECF subfamily)